jgi:glucose-1-phosphate cytidylyltransferase
MVQIGGKPILWHIMKIFYAQGIVDFEIALGFKGEQIKEYFLNYQNLNGDLTVDFSSGSQGIKHLSSVLEEWKVGLNDTGLETNTGGRLFKLRDKLGGTFICTYGDGVSNVNVRDLVTFHKSHGKVATVTAVHPSARFGSLEIGDQGEVFSFAEKPVSTQWVNGGFFVFEPKILNYLDSNAILEREPLESLAASGELMAWRHEDFWHPMDTIRDAQHLNNLWASGDAPWRIW